MMCVFSTANFIWRGITVIASTEILFVWVFFAVWRRFFIVLFFGLLSWNGSIGILIISIHGKLGWMNDIRFSNTVEEPD